MKIKTSLDIFFGKNWHCNIITSSTRKAQNFCQKANLYLLPFDSKIVSFFLKFLKPIWLRHTSNKIIINLKLKLLLFRTIFKGLIYRCICFKLCILPNLFNPLQIIKFTFNLVCIIICLLSSIPKFRFMGSVYKMYHSLIPSIQKYLTEYGPRCLLYS